MQVTGFQVSDFRSHAHNGLGLYAVYPPSRSSSEPVERIRHTIQVGIVEMVLAPTGKAVDEAIRGGAGDRGLTVAKALHLIEDDQLRLDRRTVIVVDEASMVATPALRRLLKASTATGAKMVLTGRRPSVVVG